MIVDSCIANTSKTPAALAYFEQIGVDASTNVSTIVATHWHDDHVRGISSTLEIAQNAKFFASGVFRGNEFLAIANRRDSSSRFTSGIEELARVRSIMDGKVRNDEPAICFLSAVKRIRNKPDSVVTEIWALSPSDADAQRGIEHVAALIERPGPGAKRVPSLEPNDVSVVLLLETIAGAILLGADLEHFVSSRTRGWHAIIDHDARPNSKATLFKIPHHGSYNADCPEVWQHLVIADAVSVLSPFERGRSPLPRPSDAQRIRGNTPNSFTTSDRRNLAIRRPNAVEKMIRESTRSFRPERLRMGQLQVRSKGGPWVVRGTEEATGL
jgi:hypothetical protein